MTELNTNEIYKLAFDYDRKFHYQKIIKVRLIGIMKEPDCGETIEERKQREREEQEEQEVRERRREQEARDREEELKQRERTRTDLEAQLENGFLREQADIELESAIKHQEAERIREKHAIKRKIYNKITEDYDINDNGEHYSGPFSVKIYDFKDEDIIKNTIIKCLENLNKKSSLEFKLDDTKNKFYLTEEYIIVTFYVCYELPEIELDDIQITEQPQQTTRRPSVELTNSDIDKISQRINVLNPDNTFSSYDNAYTENDILKLIDGIDDEIKRLSSELGKPINLIIKKIKDIIRLRRIAR